MPGRADDTVPCRHGAVTDLVDNVKRMLVGLPELAPQLLDQRGVSADEFPMLLRAAVESLRGTTAATTSDKRKFIEAVLTYGVQQQVFTTWEFMGTQGRQDYRVHLPENIDICIEAKGCPDGNNTTIWDRPPWAREFIVWCLCPDSLVHNPGHGIWSGIATRLMPKMTVDHMVVDAMVFWDGRCGSEWRRCPKDFGVDGLRHLATGIRGQDGRDWLPPPCIYLFPSSAPSVRNNRKPHVHTVDSCRFANAMLELFNVPAAQRPDYVHSASVEARGTAGGMQIRIEVESRNWPDGDERSVAGQWKTVRRDF